jgi:hypothetical protein
MHTEENEVVGICIDFRIAESYQTAMRMEKRAWEQFVNDLRVHLDFSTKKVVEVRIIEKDGSKKDITFAELKPLVTY